MSDKTNRSVKKMSRENLVHLLYELMEENERLLEVKAAGEAGGAAISDSFAPVPAPAPAKATESAPAPGTAQPTQAPMADDRSPRVPSWASDNTALQAAAPESSELVFVPSWASEELAAEALAPFSPELLHAAGQATVAASKASETAPGTENSKDSISPVFTESVSVPENFEAQAPVVSAPVESAPAAPMASTPAPVVPTPVAPVASAPAPVASAPAASAPMAPAAPAPAPAASAPTMTPPTARPPAAPAAAFGGAGFPGMPAAPQFMAPYGPAWTVPGHGFWMPPTAQRPYAPAWGAGSPGYWGLAPLAPQPFQGPAPLESHQAPQGPAFRSQPAPNPEVEKDNRAPQAPPSPAPQRGDEPVAAPAAVQSPQGSGPSAPDSAQPPQASESQGELDSFKALEAFCMEHLDDAELLEEIRDLTISINALKGSIDDLNGKRARTSTRVSRGNYWEGQRQ